MQEKKRMIALDADYLVFMCVDGKDVKASYFKREEGSAKGKYKEPLKPYKKKMKMLIQEVVEEISANYPGMIEGIKVCFSDPNGNFRYDFYPEYKAGRPPRSKLNKRLAKWATKKYGYIKGIEADDHVAHLVREENYIGASMDKDLWKGVEGEWFNVHYMSRTFTTCSPIQARNFNLIQTLTGDGNDNIPGIRGVAEKTAIKLLDKHGWHWKGVVAVYEEKGLTKEDAILTRRLICMRQWHPDTGVTLWEEPSNE